MKINRVLGLFVGGLSSFFCLIGGWNLEVASFIIWAIQVPIIGIRSIFEIKKPAITAKTARPINEPSPQASPPKKLSIKIFQRLLYGCRYLLRSEEHTSE